MTDPVLSGPITGGERGWAFGAAVSDLASAGYLEEEWFLEGEAPLYGFVDGAGPEFDGRWRAEPVGAMPYVTRLMVRRPVDPERASGTVLVNWNNVTTGLDVDVFETDDETFVDGTTVVGVTVQPTGVYGFTQMPLGLKVWDPVRYGRLSIPTDDLSYGIFTEASRAVGPDRRGEVDPLGGIRVTRVIATGGSQSAARLLSYLNAVQPIEKIFDAFFLTVHWGGGSPLDTGRAGPLPSMLDLVSEPWNYRKFATRFRSDLVPVFVVNSETETTSNVAVRQPDDENFRFWEIAGSSHGGGRGRAIERRFARDLDEMSPLGAFRQGTPNDLDTGPVVAAAQWYLARWLCDGTPPPSFAPIEVGGDPLKIIRDGDGIAIGGIRMPDVEAPLATLTSKSPSRGGPDSLAGSRIDFDEATIRERYGDHAGYLARYDAAVAEGVAAGFLLPNAAERLRAKARSRSLPFD
jgi:hypothetical protein